MQNRLFVLRLGVDNSPEPISYTVRARFSQSVSVAYILLTRIDRGGGEMKAIVAC